jgi:hypothetical protein
MRAKESDGDDMWEIDESIGRESLTFPVRASSPLRRFGFIADLALSNGEDGSCVGDLSGPCCARPSSSRSVIHSTFFFVTYKHPLLMEMSGRQSAVQHVSTEEAKGTVLLV